MTNLEEFFNRRRSKIKCTYPNAGASLFPTKHKSHHDPLSIPPQNCRGVRHTRVQRVTRIPPETCQ